MKESSFVTNVIRKSSEKTKPLFQTYLNRLAPIWNNLAPCTGSKKPHANRHHFQHGLGDLCDCAVGYCLSRQTRSKD